MMIKRIRSIINNENDKLKHDIIVTNDDGDDVERKETDFFL